MVVVVYLILSIVYLQTIIVPSVHSGYIGVSQAKSQPDANQYCLNTYGTTLASIHSLADNNAVTAACTSTGRVNCWIGRYCPNSISTCSGMSWTKGWDWYDGTAENYDFFQSGNEDDANRGNVIQGNGHSDTAGAWDDHHASDTEYFVCNTTPPPTKYPTPAPTGYPTPAPTAQPTRAPTTQPTPAPTAQPSKYPTKNPSKYPTQTPTDNPIGAPTVSPTNYPTFDPTFDPTYEPTNEPTFEPTFDPTFEPTMEPTFDPSSDPTVQPTDYPTFDPTVQPSYMPTTIPTKGPTKKPTNVPTKFPTKAPTEEGIVNSENTESSERNASLEGSGAASVFDTYLLYMIIAAAVMFFGIICILCCVLCKKKRKHRANTAHMKEDVQGMELVKVGSANGIQTNIEATSPVSTTNMTGAEYDGDGFEERESEAAMDDPYSDSFALRMWLQSIDLLQYYDIFIKQGFGDKMMAMRSLTSEDLKEMGIVKIAHRKIILQQIQSNQQQMASINEGDHANNTTELPVVPGGGMDELMDSSGESDHGNDDLFAPQQGHGLLTAGGPTVNDTTQANISVGAETFDNENGDEEYEYYYEEEAEDDGQGMYGKGNSNKTKQ